MNATKILIILQLYRADLVQIEPMVVLGLECCSLGGKDLEIGGQQRQIRYLQK